MNPRKYILTITVLIFFSTVFLYKKFFGKQFTIATPPMVTINLDDQPEKRWTPVIQNLSKNTLLEFAKTADNIFTEKIPLSVQEHLSALHETDLIPAEYKQELRGIEQAIKEKLGYIPEAMKYERLMNFNLAYMLFVSCTAAIVQDFEGIPYLFRNLDWPMSFLRAATINITWFKDGQKLFKSTGWPFFVGVLTGQRGNEFALALNARHDEKSLPIDNIEYALKTKNVWSSPMLMRHALQYAKNYQEVLTLFKKIKLSAPAYIILAGKQKDEGIILERDYSKTRITDTLKKWLRYYPAQPAHANPENSRSPWLLNPQHAQGPYIAITNIDSDYPQFQGLEWACKSGQCKPLLTEKKVNSIGPRYRRNSILNSCCMLQKTFTVEDLFNALWTAPVLNYQTIYSSVMCPAKNIFRSYTIYPKK